MSTSRERVLQAIEHIQPDRVPVDLGSHRSSGIMAIAYRALRRHLGLPERTLRVYDMVQQLAVVDDDVLDLFGVDAIELGRGFCREERWWKPWTLPDGSECVIPAWIDVRKEGDDWWLFNQDARPIAVQRSGALYFTQTYWPFEEGIPQDLSGLASVMKGVMWAVPCPPGPAAADSQALREGARLLRESTDRAIVALFGGNLLEWGQILCRNDNFYAALGSVDEAVERLLDRLVEIHLENLERLLTAVGPYIDVVLFGDDLGMQTGPQISPAMYRRLFKPRHARMWNRAKELAPVKVQLHCCGGVRQLLDDLIEAGLDAINPVQTACAGMAPGGLKTDFGDRLCFWGGGCDTQAVLPTARPETIVEHVLDRLRIWSPGGGFVFQQVHNIMADVPPENIAAMFDAVAQFKAVRQGETGRRKTGMIPG